MRNEIPSVVISVVADQISNVETHSSLDSLFMYAGASGDPPTGSKQVKTLEWLRRVNKDETLDPMKILGKLIEGYMEALIDPSDSNDDVKRERKGKIDRTLISCGLQYFKGGFIVGSLATPSRSLEHFIKERDFASISIEFDRALKTVESSPREAVSAACNILESLFKTYIEEEGIEMPAKQDLQPVWNVVRNHLGFSPGLIDDRDIKEILSGIFAIVSGIGALRTHASSAHGSDKKTYRLEPRHARLAVHAAHTLTIFIIETWDKKQRIGHPEVTDRT